MSNSKKTTNRSNSKTAAKNKKSVLSVLATILTILSLAVSGLLIFGLVSNARKACTNTFNQAYEETKESVFNKFKQKAFDYFEAKNHVSNRVTLTIGNIKKENSLEVLIVSDSWIKISDPDTDEDRTSRWVEFTATGVYTVDMSTSEFIIDDYNKFVLVKLKTPRLTHIKLDNDPKVYLYKYKKGFGKVNGDYDSGVQMMLEDREEASEHLTEQLESNDSNLAKAKTSAENLIRTFIKSVNPDMELTDENIQIEFV